MAFLNPYLIFCVLALVCLIVIAVVMMCRASSKGMLNLRYYECRMQVLSVILPVGLALFDLICVGGFPDEMIVADIIISPAILLLCPARHEKALMSYRYSIWLFWIQVLLIVLFMFGRVKDWPSVGQLRCSLSLLTTQALVSWYLVRRTYIRYSSVRRLFSNISVWHAACDASRFIYFMWLAFVISLSGCYGMAGMVACTCLTCALYLICFMRITEESGYVVGAEVEECIKDAIRGRMYDRAYDTPGEDRKMIRLFENVKKVMETNKPYRNELFSIQDLATSVLTNKAYLSRTINIMAGCNFRQFVNWYRIEEAKEYIKQDPSRKLIDIQDCCGFRNHQTFDAAFQRACGESPRAYQERQKLSSVTQKYGMPGQGNDKG